MYIKVNVRKLAILSCFIFSVLFLVNFIKTQNNSIKLDGYKRIIVNLKRQMQECETNLENAQNIIADISKYKQTIDTAPEFIVTAYDLSFASTNKYKSSRGYGRTKNGYDLRNKTWEEARTIAVDPNIIPLNSVIYLYFLDDDYKIYNGIYYCRDSGSAIKSNRIDLFHGDYDSSKPAKEVLDFGVTKAKVILLDY